MPNGTFLSRGRAPGRHISHTWPICPAGHPRSVPLPAVSGPPRGQLPVNLPQQMMATVLEFTAGWPGGQEPGAVMGTGWLKALKFR